MWNRPVFQVHIILRCPPRLCPWSTTLRHVHHSSQYPHFLLLPKPSPLCRWHSALSFLPSDSLRLQHRSPSQCSRSNFVLDDCKSSYTEFLHNWFFLLIGVSIQLAKINNSSSCTPLVSVPSFPLSAAFDTIDHDILIIRLSSCFGSWFKSYRSSGSSHIGQLVASVSNVKPTCRQVDEDDAKPVVDVEVEVDAVLDERPQFRSTADHRLHTPQTAYDQWCK